LAHVGSRGRSPHQIEPLPNAGAENAAAAGFEKMETGLPAQSGLTAGKILQAWSVFNRLKKAILVRPQPQQKNGSGIAGTSESALCF
jgi:hypothetical protein